MEDCDYCEESFDDEPAYLDHLAAEHEGELGRIDRRRVQQRTTDDEGRSTVTYVGLGLAVALIAALGVAGLTGAFGDLLGGSSGGTGPYGLPGSGADQHLQAVETFPNQGRQHTGGDVNYVRQPPLSGPHAGTAADAGFYERTVEYEPLVHSLEHGAVVIYYDPAALTDDAESDLREKASRFTDSFASVVVVPNPEDDPQAAYVVTAWRARLTMESYDPEVVRSFLAEYLGRGPERPVR
jgi:hypothetical protein